MQVQNINPQNHNTNFQAIKSVKIDGLYKQYPSKAKEILDVFINNKKAQNFCNKYDVDIVLTTIDQNHGALESKFIMFYDNPLITGFKKAFKSLFGEREKIELSAYKREYVDSINIEEATNTLKNYLLPDSMSKGKSVCGVLDSHIKCVEDEIDAAMIEQFKKKTEKETAKRLKEQEMSKAAKEQEELKATIDKLVNKN